MKTNYCLLILLNVAWLSNCEDTWTAKFNKLSNSHLRELSKIAKVTQNTEAVPTIAETSWLARKLPEVNPRKSRMDSEGDDEEHEQENVVARKNSEAVRNEVSDEGSKPKTGTEKKNSTSATQPGRRVTAGKRKQPAKTQTASKPVASEGTPKPTKYHYYPHNQHIYLLPECAIQQVCNAVYVRLNYTQPLCACPSRKEPCSASLNADDMHTTELVTASTGKVLTLVKTCEPVAEMRICRAPRDWSLLALQNVRTGKSHYLVICRCPHKGRLEGPMSHDQPAYASVPGIRVYGMMCVRDSYRISRPFRYRRSLPGRNPEFPWDKIKEFQSSVEW